MASRRALSSRSAVESCKPMESSQGRRGSASLSRSANGWNALVHEEQKLRCCTYIMLSVACRTGVGAALSQWFSGLIILSHWGLSSHCLGGDLAWCCNQQPRSGKLLEPWLPCGIHNLIHTVAFFLLFIVVLKSASPDHDQNLAENRCPDSRIQTDCCSILNSDAQHMPYDRWTPSWGVHGAHLFGEWECWRHLWLLPHCFAFCTCLHIGLNSCTHYIWRNFTSRLWYSCFDLITHRSEDRSWTAARQGQG